MNLPKIGEKYKYPNSDTIHTIMDLLPYNQGRTIIVIKFDDCTTLFEVYDYWFHQAVKDGLFLLENSKTNIYKQVLFGCTHTFKLYQGFTESYNYCTKCDHKSNI